MKAPADANTVPTEPEADDQVTAPEAEQPDEGDDQVTVPEAEQPDEGDTDNEGDADIEEVPSSDYVGCLDCKARAELEGDTSGDVAEPSPSVAETSTADGPPAAAPVVTLDGGTDSRPSRHAPVAEPKGDGGGMGKLAPLKILVVAGVVGTLALWGWRRLEARQLLPGQRAAQGSRPSAPRTPPTRSTRMRPGIWTKPDWKPGQHIRVDSRGIQRAEGEGSLLPTRDTWVNRRTTRPTTNTRTSRPPLKTGRGRAVDTARRTVRP